MGMKDVVGIDNFKLGETSYADEDLNALSLEQLEELKLKINTNILSISSKIKSKQAEYSAGGEGASSEWFIGANHALNVNQRFMPYLSAMIRKRRQTGRSLDSYFVDVARETLSAQRFQDILNEARARYDANRL